MAYRVIAANRVPDHSTIAELRCRHERAIADLFGEVLALWRAAGMVNVGVIEVDGTKVHANAFAALRSDNAPVYRGRLLSP